MSTIRPVVFDYTNPSEFFRDLGEHYRETRRGFSIRSKSKNVKGCSPSLITQVLKGQRKLKRDQLFNFAQVFGLTTTEINHIDNILKADQSFIAMDTFSSPSKESVRKIPKNHLLVDWLHPYVKDLVELKGFKLDVKWMLQHLGFAAKPVKIEKSVQFLLKEGFWRKTLEGHIVLDEAAVITTNEIPNEKIKAFHKQALKVAARGLEEFPISRRKSSTILVAVNKDSKEELKALINKFQSDLVSFMESHSQDKEELVQVTFHMTPVGGQDVKK